MEKKSIGLQEKLNKATERVERRKKTIERYLNQIAKKKKEIESKGWDINNRYCKEGTEEFHESFCTISDYKVKIQAMEEAKKKLQDDIRIKEGWAKKLKNALEIENEYEYKLPDVFKTLQEYYVKDWTENDVYRKKIYEEELETMGYDKFTDKYGYNTYCFLKNTEEDFRKANEEYAYRWILELYNRVKKYTGEVESWGHLYAGYKGELNGLVHGQLGSVKVESILAGGYNIQRLHARVLIHPIELLPEEAEQYVKELKEKMEREALEDGIVTPVKSVEVPVDPVEEEIEAMEVKKEAIDGNTDLLERVLNAPRELKEKIYTGLKETLTSTPEPKELQEAPEAQEELQDPKDVEEVTEAPQENTLEMSEEYRKHVREVTKSIYKSNSRVLKNWLDNNDYLDLIFMEDYFYLQAGHYCLFEAEYKDIYKEVNTNTVKKIMDFYSNVMRIITQKEIKINDAIFKKFVDNVN